MSDDGPSLFVQIGDLAVEVDGAPGESAEDLEETFSVVLEQAVDVAHGFNKDDEPELGQGVQ